METCASAEIVVSKQRFTREFAIPQHATAPRSATTTRRKARRESDMLFQDSWDNVLEQIRLRAERSAAERLLPRQEKKWGWSFWLFVGIVTVIVMVLIVAWAVPSPELREWARKWIPGY